MLGAGKNGTHFPWAGNGENYISGKTNFRDGDISSTGSITANGIINAGGGGIGIGPGTGDGASFTTYNGEIRSWYGTAFRDTCFNKTNVVVDHRTGIIHCKGIKIYDTNGNSTLLHCFPEPNRGPTKFNISFYNSSDTGVGGNEIYAGGGCWWKGGC